jgi:hypothetical protein
MEFSNPPAKVLDKRFFQVTGIVMVLATLLAGTITLWLANDVATIESPGTINLPPTLLQTSERLVGESAVVNVSLEIDRSNVQLPLR